MSNHLSLSRAERSLILQQSFLTLHGTNPTYSQVSCLASGTWGQLSHLVLAYWAPLPPLPMPGSCTEGVPQPNPASWPATPFPGCSQSIAEKPWAATSFPGASGPKSDGLKASLFGC